MKVSDKVCKITPKFMDWLYGRAAGAAALVEKHKLTEVHLRRVIKPNKTILRSMIQFPGLLHSSCPDFDRMAGSETACLICDGGVPPGLE